MIGPDDVRAAARVLDGVAHRTPVVRSRTLGEHVVLKPECLQRGGAFKFRGAYNKIASLPDGQRRSLAFSSGNHAQAVALASRLLGAHATILMPEDAPQSKLDATRGYGAEVVTYDRYSGDRDALGAALAAERACDARPAVRRSADHGRGRDGGARADRGRRRRRHARRAGRRRRADLGLRDDRQGPRRAARRRRRARGGRRLAADRSPPASRSRSTCRGRSRTGCRRPRPGSSPGRSASQLVDEIVTVTDAQIVEAMRFAFERLKLVVEPSGAVGHRGAAERARRGAVGRHRHLRRQRRRRPVRRATRRVTRARSAATRARS